LIVDEVSNPGTFSHISFLKPRKSHGHKSEEEERDKKGKRTKKKREEKELLFHD
jgi:hypothetical protein